MRTLAVLAALVVAAPALAQANADAAPPVERAASVDPALVGEWTLIKVQEAGEIGRFGGEIEAMSCEFDADGSAEVELTVLQDRDLHTHDQTFEFDTEDGTIVRSGAPPVQYQVLGKDLLVLRDSAGLVVQLVRVGE